MTSRLPPLTLPPAVPPRAQTDQQVSSAVDDTLTTHARTRHPSVVWWWGARQRQEGFGAYCYLCDMLIARWSRRWPITQTARSAVLDHRRQHIRQLGGASS